MIRLDSVALQHGRQILFLDASAVVNRGEHVGLVGPNGAGKSTLFRLIVKEEEPDEGRVSVDRGVSIGYFSQDAGEMSKLLERFGHVQARFEELGGYGL